MPLRVGAARLRAPSYGAQPSLMSLCSLEEGGEASRGSLTFQASEGWRPRRDSNPCFSLERATSWASGRRGRVGGRSERRGTRKL